MAESEVEEILLLKVVQSALVRSPLLVADDDGMLRVSEPPSIAGEPETPTSVPVEPRVRPMVLALRRLVPIVVVATTWPFALVERMPLVIDGRKNEVAAERLVVDAEATVSSEPLNVRDVPEVILLPSK